MRNLLFKFGFGLFVCIIICVGDCDVGSVVENVLVIKSVLVKCCLFFCVVVIYVGRVDWGSSNVILKSVKVGK